jgi:hypothetical protein
MEEHPRRLAGKGNRLALRFEPYEIRTLLLK